MPIYAKPVWGLMDEAATQLPEPFSRTQIVRWFKDNYPQVKHKTVTAHTVSCCVNDSNRRWHNVNSSKDVLYRLPGGSYVKYDRNKHGDFTSQGTPVSPTQPGAIQAEEKHDHDIEADAEFVLEKHLAEFVYANWNRIDFGADLTIYMDSLGREGREWDTGEIGVIDFLCEDKDNGDLVVIELKRGRATDKVLGQIQRYMGWVRENLAQNRHVRGMIITPSRLDEDLRYALKVAPHIEWKWYQVDFRLISPPEEP